MVSLPLAMQNAVQVMQMSCSYLAHELFLLPHLVLLRLSLQKQVRPGAHASVWLALRQSYQYGPNRMVGMCYDWHGQCVTMVPESNASYMHSVSSNGEMGAADLLLHHVVFNRTICHVLVVVGVVPLTTLVVLSLGRCSCKDNLQHREYSSRKSRHNLLPCLLSEGNPVKP